MLTYLDRQPDSVSDSFICSFHLILFTDFQEKRAGERQMLWIYGLTLSFPAECKGQNRQRASAFNLETSGSWKKLTEKGLPMANLN